MLVAPYGDMTRFEQQKMNMALMIVFFVCGTNVYMVMHARTLTHVRAYTHTHTHIYIYVCLGEGTVYAFGSLAQLFIHCNTLQHNVPNGTTHQHAAANCNTLQHTATHCNTLQHTQRRWAHEPRVSVSAECITSAHSHSYTNTATHCNTLQHTASHCTTLHHTATHGTPLQHTASHAAAVGTRVKSFSEGRVHASQLTLAHTLHHTPPHCTTRSGGGHTSQEFQ